MADIDYFVESGVGRIELNRPSALNAWTPSFGTELLAVVRLASQDSAVRAVLLSGAGPAFSAGADVKNKRELTPTGVPDLSTRLQKIYNPIILAIRASRVPFVAAVQGACAGLGVSLALACDFIVAAEDAFFLLAFVRLGVMPDGGATLLLTERLGLSRASELCLLGERLHADRALQWGLVRSVVPRNELLNEAMALTTTLASFPPVIVGETKRALLDGHMLAMSAQLELEANLQQRHGGSRDYAEAIAAFAAKRKPQFSGS